MKMKKNIHESAAQWCYMLSWAFQQFAWISISRTDRLLLSLGFHHFTQLHQVFIFHLNVHSKWLCSSHRCLSVPALIGCDGNTTPWGTRPFSPLFRHNAVMHVEVKDAGLLQYFLYPPLFKKHSNSRCWVWNRDRSWRFKKKIEPLVAKLAHVQLSTEMRKKAKYLTP